MLLWTRELVAKLTRVAFLKRSLKYVLLQEGISEEGRLRRMCRVLGSLSRALVLGGRSDTSHCTDKRTGAQG